MTFRSRFLLVSSALPLALLCAAASAQRQKAPKKPARAAVAAKTDTFTRDIAPLMGRYCNSCHGDKGASADLSLTPYKDTASVLAKRKIWERVAANVSAGHMPPQGMPQPTPAERDRIVGWIESTISQADCRLDDPGRVTLRRLNREEYNNTVRDLIGLDLRPADDFPSDDVGYGFDNIGDVLSISPLLMEKYLTVAEKIAKAAIVTPEEKGKPAKFAGSRLGGSSVADFSETDGRLLGTERGEVSVEHAFPADGEYTIRVEAFGQQAGPEPVRMAMRLDGKEIGRTEVKAVQNKPETYPARVRVSAGKHTFAVSFLNNYRKPDAPPPNDRNLIIQSIEIRGPLGANGQILPPPSHRRIISVQPSTPATEKQAARKIVGDFARRAWRRPVTQDEVTRLTRYVQMARKEGESFERGVQLAMQAILVSPHFLFRVEIDPQATLAPQANNPKSKHLLGSYELASRLSYFLWSSMPDEELFKVAASGKLQNPDVLTAQAKRMLKDPKARALAQNFAGQWLQIRKLSQVSPDPTRFPAFDDGLRTAMRTETEMFFEAIVRDDRSVLDFLDGRFTYLNAALAKHYGIAGVTGDRFRKVALTDKTRGGILTHASILTVTSNPTRTSPVKRGKWVLEQILGTPPPPAPPGVPELADDKHGPLTGTLRQRLEQHRSNPACASCHQRMDPIGFGLENFDAVGAWRKTDGDAPIDASGVLPDGKKFNGPAQLRAIMLEKKPQFVRTFSERLLTYALGRGIESYDKCNLDEIAQGVAKNGYKFSSVVSHIVQSDPFRKRRGDARKANTKKVATRADR